MVGGKIKGARNCGYAQMEDLGCALVYARLDDLACAVDFHALFWQEGGELFGDFLRYFYPLLKFPFSVFQEEIATCRSSRLSTCISLRFTKVSN